MWTALVAISAALGFVQLYNPAEALGNSPLKPLGLVTLTHFSALTLSLGNASENAFGRSGDVKVLFALPGEKVYFPLGVGGDPTTVTYEWTSLRGIETGFLPRPIDGAAIATPTIPGFYYLTLVHGAERQIVREPALAVMRPFQEKLGAMLNGYRIGTYLAETRKGNSDNERPQGFVEIYPEHLDLAVSKHLRVRDFMTHDDQAKVWPKYVVLNPRLLDKLELVFAELESQRSADGAMDRELELDVHSGFRTPSYNKRIRRAARDSRHLYGDAADIVVDVNCNGRIDRADQRLIVAAVELVERTHPDLIGGLGVYSSSRHATPYVHIDARGTRSRWRS
jgi:uncharacterized protein YcbK (DUF882 family)